MIPDRRSHHLSDQQLGLHLNLRQERTGPTRTSTTFSSRNSNSSADVGRNRTSSASIFSSHYSHNQSSFSFYPRHFRTSVNLHFSSFHNLTPTDKYRCSFCMVFQTVDMTSERIQQISTSARSKIHPHLSSLLR